MTTTSAIAAAFDRLFPDMVDETISGNGQQTSGHVQHDGYRDGDDAELIRVAYSDAGGNSGNPVMDLLEGDEARILAALASLSAPCTIQAVEAALTAADIWYESRY